MRCRCLQNAKVALLENDISLCQSSGVYMSLAAHGIIAGNDIYFTSENGLDVRRQADPTIQVHMYVTRGLLTLWSRCQGFDNTWRIHVRCYSAIVFTIARSLVSLYLDREQASSKTTISTRTERQASQSCTVATRLSAATGGICFYSKNYRSSFTQ